MTPEEALARAEGALAGPISCERAEAIIAARLAGPIAPATEGALDAHLDGCEPCAELAEAAGDTEVGDVILDFGAVPEKDLPDLGVVARELYVRGHEVGRGGMGRIVRARDRRLGRAVAIKELLDDRLRARFEREARLTARLQHPGVVNVLEAGRWEDGSPFYAMKYVAGRPLSEALAGKRTLAGRLGYLPHLIAAVDAIAYAHSERIVHRDVKPHNILLGPFGETVVVDWGLAKDLTEREPDEPAIVEQTAEAELTRAGAGTPGYMPPEQARGDEPTERVDVFALGATLYHLLAGKPPDEPIAKACPEAPAELAAIVEKAMDPEPLHRYVSAAELAAELKRFQTGQLVRAHQYSLGQLLRRWLRRWRVPLVIAGLVVLISVGIGWVALSRVLEARRDALAERDRTEVAHGDLLVELARQDLLAGASADAIDKLRQLRGARTVVARFLAAEAQRRLWRQVRVLPGALLRYPETAMAFTAGGDLVMSAGPHALVWNLQSGGVSATLVEDRFDPAPERRFETAGEWLLDRGRLWSLVDGSGQPVQAGAELVGDSGALVTVGQTLRFGELLLRPREGKRFLAAAVSPDLERIAAVEEGGQVTLRDGRGRELARLAGAPDLRLSFSPTSRTLLGVSGGTVTSWESAGGRELARFAIAPGAELRWSRDGDWIAVFDRRGDGQVRIVSPAGTLEGSLGFETRPVLVEFVGDSQRLLTVAGGTATLWDVSGRALSTSRLPAVAHGAALHPAGDLVAVAGADGTRVFKLPRDLPGVYLGDAEIAALAFGIGGEVVLADPRGNVTLHDGREPRPLESIAGWSEPRLFATEAGIVATGRADGVVRLERYAEDGRRRPWAPGLDLGDVRRVHAIGPAGAVVENRAGDVARAEAGAAAWRRLVARRAAAAVLVSDDGRWLALGWADRTEIWTLDGPKQVATAPAPLVLPARFVGKAGDLVVSARPGPPERWSIRERTVLRLALPGTSPELPIFRDDGELWAETLPTGRMRLLAGMRPLADYPPMRPVAFRPDGQRLVVVAGKQVRLLDVGEE